jgi:transcriptional regulator with XRE-family HTH domain
LPQCLRITYEVSRKDGRMNKARKDPKSVPEIAARVKLLRRALGLSQADMSKAAGVTERAWSNYETAYGRISLDTAFGLVRAFNVTLDWIYLGNAAMMPHHLMQKIAEVEAAEEREDEIVNA